MFLLLNLYDIENYIDSHFLLFKYIQFHTLTIKNEITCNRTFISPVWLWHKRSVKESPLESRVFRAMECFDRHHGSNVFIVALIRLLEESR